MEIGAILLLMMSAAIHSGWNLLAKRSRDQATFLWLALIAAGVIFLAPFLLFYRPIPPVGWAIMGASAVLEAGYFALLGRAYGGGDLSLVYPLVRGSAILCATALAAGLLGEGPAPGGWAGIGLILLGLYVLHLRSFEPAGWRAPFAALHARPSQLAVLTGLATGSASVLDKVGVRTVDPALYIYPVFALAGLLLAPVMLRTRPAAVRQVWREQRAAICTVGVLFMAGYLLVLFALRGAHVSYVAAVREIAVVFAALIGTLVLREPFGRAKVLGAALIFAGILAIALA